MSGSTTWAFRPAAAIVSTERFVEVSAWAGLRAYRRDTAAFQACFAPSVSDEDLGHAVAAALAASRLMSLEEANATMNRDALSKESDEWIGDKLARYGYKNRSQLYKGMKNVDVQRMVNGIRFMSWRKYRMDGWVPIDGPEGVILLPLDTTDDQLGAAARAALERSL